MKSGGQSNSCFVVKADGSGFVNLCSDAAPPTSSTPPPPDTPPPDQPAVPPPPPPAVSAASVWNRFASSANGFLTRHHIPIRVAELPDPQPPSESTPAALPLSPPAAQPPAASATPDAPPAQPMAAPMCSPNTKTWADKCERKGEMDIPVGKPGELISNDDVIKTNLEMNGLLPSDPQKQRQAIDAVKQAAMKTPRPAGQDYVTFKVAQVKAAMVKADLIPADGAQKPPQGTDTPKPATKRATVASRPRLAGAPRGI